MTVVAVAVAAVAVAAVAADRRERVAGTARGANVGRQLAQLPWFALPTKKPPRSDRTTRAAYGGAGWLPAPPARFVVVHAVVGATRGRRARRTTPRVRARWLLDAEALEKASAAGEIAEVTNDGEDGEQADDPGDPYDLGRFVAAQEADYARALSEIRRGRKQSHWMWYIFPQLAGLGRSSMSRRPPASAVRSAGAAAS